MDGASAVRRRLMAALVAYCLLLALALLWPTSGTQSRMAHWVVDIWVWLGIGQNDWPAQDRAEFLCNMVIVAPVTALGSLLWPRYNWRDWTAVILVGASLVEITQGALLPYRNAAYVDVVANTLGGTVGALLVLFARWSLAARERRQELHRRPRLDQD